MEHLIHYIRSTALPSSQERVLEGHCAMAPLLALPFSKKKQQNKWYIK